MNPETNEFEKIDDLDAFRERFYPDAPVDQVPTFTMGEEITIKGYVFQVIQMQEDRMALRPVRLVDAEFDIEEE